MHSMSWQHQLLFVATVQFVKTGIIGYGNVDYTSGDIQLKLYTVPSYSKVVTVVTISFYEMGPFKAGLDFK